MPQSAPEQRVVRLKQALEGVVSDGLLFRMSAVRLVDQPALHGELAAFARSLVAAVDPRMLQALIGREYARLFALSPHCASPRSSSIIRPIVRRWLGRAIDLCAVPAKLSHYLN